jgi:acyl carrier protein
MSTDPIRDAVLESLKTVAPEADLGSLAGTSDLRDALDIDSMDFLRFIVDVHARVHVDIPERDYAKVRTLDTCVAYLRARRGAP